MGGLLFDFAVSRASRLLYFVAANYCPHLLEFRNCIAHSFAKSAEPQNRFLILPTYNLKAITKVIAFKLSVGGLEPPQISPHAPQTCASTIPPHRHIYDVFKYKFIITKTYFFAKTILRR